MRCVILSIVLTLGLARLGASQVTLKITQPGGATGQAKVSQHIASDGGKLVELNMDLVVGGRRITVHQQSKFDRHGAPLRKVLDLNDEATHRSRQVIVSFDPAGANLVFERGGGRRPRSVTLAPSAPRENASEFWFVRDKPAPGAKVRCYVFDLDSLEWVLTDTTFVGKRPVKIGVKTIVCNHVSVKYPNKTVEADLDDSGLPVRVVSPDTKMERAAG